MAKIELHVLAGQCLNRRLPDQATHNAATARIKLKHLYPLLDD